MAKTVGVVLSNRIAIGLVVDHKVQGELRIHPEGEESDGELVELHTEALVRTVCEQVIRFKDSQNDISAVGVAVPGLVKAGVIEDSPNLPQLKGARLAELLSAELHNHGLNCPVEILNDADGVAAGLAAREGRLKDNIRVWTLGVGIGYGCYPDTPNFGEGGHTTVTLDSKENFCGCGGRGHMEGIMGHRAMRLRFLDMEPEEIFAESRKGDRRCREFVELWHKALAAGTASSIHVSGPGRFFITDFNARFVDLKLVKEYVHQMVKMSPFQSYSLEIVKDSPETRVIGSAVAAEHAIARKRTASRSKASKEPS